MPIKKKTVNHQIMKEINSKAILNTLRIGGPKSRSALAKELMLDGTTVTNLVRSLLSEDLISTSGDTTRRTRGKPGELLAVNSDGAQVIGISLSDNMTITGVLINLEGKVISRESVEFQHNSSGEKIIQKMRKISLNLFNRSDKNKLIGISIALPGIWRKDKNIFIRSASIPELVSFDLKKLQLTEIPPEKTLFIGNLASLAEAEMWFGNFDYDTDTIFVHLDTGIGASCFFGGRLIVNKNKIGGEFGHSYVGPDVKCSCGKYGCLEAFASIPVINSRFAKEHSLTINDILEFEFFDEVVDAFENHDKLTEQMIQEIAEKIACAVGNAINLLGPSSVIFGGILVRLGDRFLNIIAENLKKYIVPEIFFQLSIKTSTLLDDNYTPLGAVVPFLKKFFLGDRSA